MALWVFKCFLTNRGENEIRAWLNGLPKKARIKIDVRLRHLANVKHLQNEPQYIKPMKGFDGILEIRIVSNGVQYRPLCCYGPELRELTLLIGAIEKDWGLEPHGALQLAADRMKIIMSDRRRVCDYLDE